MGNNPLNYQNTYPVTAVGTRYDINTPFFARSISIDNPSGMWLKVQPIRRYVPPFSTGWKATLPGVRVITILLVAAPVGAAASVVSGGPIDVDVSEDETDDYPGEIYNLIATIGVLDTKLDTLNTTMVAFIAALNALKSGYGTTPILRAALNVQANNVPVILIAATLGKSIVILNIQFSWNANGTHRGEISASVSVAGAQGTDVVLTPDNPNAYVPITPAAFDGTFSQPCYANAATSSDSTVSNSVWIVVDYYIQ